MSAALDTAPIPDLAKYEEIRRRLERRGNELRTVRSSWDGQIIDIGDYIMPRRVRMTPSDTNNGTKKNQKIINGAATKAVRVLGAGMHAGISSPVRPWHQLALPNEDLMKRGEVKMWLNVATERQRTVFSRSNFYNALAQFYEDLALHGTAVMWIDEDDEDTIRCHVVPWGEYWLALDARGRPTMLRREFQMSVWQLVNKFTVFRCSDEVRRLYKEGAYDTMIDVVHVVEPRGERDITKQDGLNMAYSSYWYEKTADHTKFLKEWGYEECPFVAARWSVTGSDTYGSGPSFDAIGDVKALQELEKESAKAAALIVKPPMKGPSSLRGASIIPGAWNAIDASSGNATFEPALKISESAIKIFEEKIQRHEIRIKETYYADLWLMLAASDRREITAREIDERHEEKMLQLGPVLVRLHDEALDPAIKRIFMIMWRKRMIPPVPAAMRGVELRVEYTSILAQAQKLLSTSAVERFIAFVGNVASVRKDVLDRINWDEMIRHYGDILGIKPDLILPDDVVARIREARQRVEQQQMQLQAQLAAAEGAKTMSQADLSGNNILTSMLGNMGAAVSGSVAA